MRRFVLEVSAAIALTVAAIFTTATGVSASDMMVMNAYARASATPVAKSGAVYVTVMNHGGAADRLLSVSTPAAKSATLHKTEDTDGVMKMTEAGPVEIAAGTTFEMKPGGYHIMLMGLEAPLKEGGSIELTLAFEKAGAVTVKVLIGGVAEGSHDHTSEDSDG